MKTHNNTGSKAPWWFKYRQQRYKKLNFLSMEMIIRKSIVDTLKEYWLTTSIGGIKQIRNSENSKFERVCYVVIFCFTLFLVCQYLHSTYAATFNKPFVVTSESSTHPIKNIDFPAVALCNLNRISKKALHEYSLHALNKSLESGRRKITLFELENYFRQFSRFIGYLYDRTVQGIVNNAPLDDSKINIPQLMDKLSPRCDEMLIKCKWAGRVVNCSEIFYTRRTGLGHCCAFNYVLGMHSADSPTETIAPIKKQEVPGFNNGLIVIADPMSEDNAYQITNINGFELLIYDPRQFPERSGGRALYRLAQPNQVEVLQLESIKQYAAAEVHKYPPDTRNCLFRTELKESFSNMYSYSACLVKCRIQTIKSLCNCIPYFYPSKIENNTRTCRLGDLKCLHKYHDKLLYLYPRNAKNSIGLESEFVDSLFCPECLPDCELTQHFARNYKLSLSKTSGLWFGDDFADGVNLTDKCILSIYHPTADGVLHRLDVVSYWYEILSNIGGFSGMVMGICGFTFTEFFYYVIIRFPRSVYINYKKYH